MSEDSPSSNGSGGRSWLDRIASVLSGELRSRDQLIEELRAERDASEKAAAEAAQEAEAAAWLEAKRAEEAGDSET